MSFKKSYFTITNVFLLAIILTFVIYSANFKKPMFTHFDGLPLCGLWRFNLPIVDEHGNYLYSDGELNMALLIHTDMSKNEKHEIIDKLLPIYISPNRSVIFKETVHETTIDAIENSLVVINNTTDVKKIIPLNFNFHKKHYLALNKKHHNPEGDLKYYNIFQDMIEILPDHVEEINNVYLTGKDEPQRNR